MMSILTKVLLGLVVVATLPLLYLTSATMKVNHTWRVKVREFDKAVAAQAAQNFDLLHGDRNARVESYDPAKPVVGKPGVRQLEAALESLKRGRGRFWYAIRNKASIDPMTGTLKVEIYDANVENPSDRKPLNEHQIKDKSFVYLFQLRHDGAKAPEDRYLGEFVVNGLPPDATDALVPLKPSVPLDQAGWDALTNGVDQWIVYEHMPLDDHDVFNDLTEDEIRGRVPTSVAEEYVNDKKAPTDAVTSNAQLQQFVVEDKDSGQKVFLRPLRDYQQIFRNLSSQMSELSDRLTVLRKEHEFALSAKTKAEQLIVQLDSRKKKLDEEKLLLDQELALIRTKRESLDGVLAEAQKSLATRLSENKRLADQLAGLGRKTAAAGGLQEATSRTP